MSTPSRPSPTATPTTDESTSQTRLRRLVDFALIAAMIAAPFLLTGLPGSDAQPQANVIPDAAAVAQAPGP